MKEVLLKSFRRISDLINKNNNFIAFLCLMNLFLTFSWPLYLHLESSDSRYHYYMNTKTSLERINNVELDSYDGDIAHRLTTEERLIRRQNRRFHVRYLFK